MDLQLAIHCHFSNEGSEVPQYFVVYGVVPVSG
jgi:hypothetical protein